MKAVEINRITSKVAAVALILLAIILLAVPNHKNDYLKQEQIPREESPFANRPQDSGRNKVEKKFFYLDLDQDDIVDTIKAVHTLYGPGINQPVPFEKVAAGYGVPNKAYYLMSDFILVKDKHEFPIIKIEKDESFMAFPPLAIDSFVIRRLPGRAGFYMENVCVETTPEVTYLKLIKIGSAYSIQAYGRINTSHETYLDKLSNDTCEATVNISLSNNKRVSFRYLEDTLYQERWRCYGSRKRGADGKWLSEIE